MARIKETFNKHPSEARNFAISLTRVLDEGELLTGTPTAAGSPTGLTFDNLRVNTGPIVVKGETVATGMAIQGRVAGGVNGKGYECDITCATDASPAQTIVVEFQLFASDR